MRYFCGFLLLLWLVVPSALAAADKPLLQYELVGLKGTPDNARPGWGRTGTPQGPGELPGDGRGAGGEQPEGPGVLQPRYRDSHQADGAGLEPAGLP